MELRDLAEQILFATTLEDKLRPPPDITDEHPGPALAAPALPGRPAELRFKPTGAARGEFPGLRHLERERERGRLLHFFANHELLATELMALVLLRFPEAPAAFRKGVLQTLRDEQEHTRLYLRRMKECGIHFGELPVSGYFWRSVSVMENPMDYVSSLCLTFEQANLDFARHFARGFAVAGDDVTARLLERIYRDEIGHVAYGLKWFRRWKNPGESDWDAFCRQLKFPLSPQRAKGITLNIEGRRAAGLDARFIAELDVYSQSRGRTPNVFVFNPFTEGCLARGKTFTPTKAQAQLARDLASLPQFLCRQDDVVLVEQRPSVEWLSGIKQAGFALPEFVETDRIQELGRRKLGRLRPWAWGPDSAALLEPLFAGVTGEDRTPRQRFNPGIGQLYSKGWSAAFLKRFLHSLPEPDSLAPSLCRETDVGAEVQSLPEALEAIAVIRQRGHHPVVAKQALGLAGANAIRLFEPEILDAHRRWMAHSLEHGQRLVIEPWLDRLRDFSVQLEMTTDGLKLCGYTELITTAQGRFRGNRVAPKFQRRLPAAVTGCFPNMPDLAARLPAFYETVFAALEPELRQAEYLGPVGIDAFVYRTGSGEPRLKPVVEINPRYTMGRLAVELMNRVAPGSYGQLELLHQAAVQRLGFDSLAGYARSLAERFPPVFEGEPVRRIRRGDICLNDPARAMVCLAVFRVTREPTAPDPAI